MTVSFDDFHQVLGQVARDFGSDSKIAEAELVNRWFMAGVFSELGYGSHRDDYRVERKIQGAGRADVVLRSFAQRARAVIEFKRPLTPLDDHVKQVREYADRLLPDVAILTNGKDLWLYGRQGPLPLDPLRAEPSRYDLTALTPTDARILFDQLRKLEVDISNLEALTGALDDLQARPVRVEGPQSPGGVAFLERFGLDKQSVFGRLVSVPFDALPVLQYTSQFTDGAYAFWDRAYARELSSDDAPKTWGSVLRDRTGKEEVRRFMFCLESGYAVLARALLAKAMQDAGFPNMDVIGAFRRSAENRQSQGRLPPRITFLCSLRSSTTLVVRPSRVFPLRTSSIGGRMLGSCPMRVLLRKRCLRWYSRCSASISHHSKGMFWASFTRTTSTGKPGLLWENSIRRGKS